MASNHVKLMLAVLAIHSFCGCTGTIEQDDNMTLGPRSQKGWVLRANGLIAELRELAESCPGREIDSWGPSSINCW